MKVLWGPNLGGGRFFFFIYLFFCSLFLVVLFLFLFVCLFLTIFFLPVGWFQFIHTSASLQRREVLR